MQRIIVFVVLACAISTSNARPVRPVFEGAFLWHGIMGVSTAHTYKSAQTDGEISSDIRAHAGAGLFLSAGIGKEFWTTYVGFRYADSENREDYISHLAPLTLQSFYYYRWIDRRIFIGGRIHPDLDEMRLVQPFFGGGMSVGWVRRTYNSGRVDTHSNGNVYYSHYFHGLNSGATGGAFLEAGFIRRIAAHWSAILQGQAQVINLQLHDPEGYLSIGNILEGSLNLGFQFKP